VRRLSSCKRRQKARRGVVSQLAVRCLGHILPFVPAKAGTQSSALDSRFRGNERSSAVGGPVPAVARRESLLYSRLGEARGEWLFRTRHRRSAGATWRSGYATVCKTVYPGSIPGVASKSINAFGPNAAAPKPAPPTRMIGPRIDGEAARKLLVVPPSRFQQRCLQTSCWLVQLRLQAPLLPDPAGFASVAAVVGMQAF
jgi:hypothetical protein